MFILVGVLLQVILLPTWIWVKTKAEFHCETREEAISNYEKYILNKIKNKDPKICSELNRIYSMVLSGDVNLVCFCKPKSCHGDIIKMIIENKIDELNNKNQKKCQH